MSYEFKWGEAKKIKPGTIMVGSWGYDQTNHEFCKVIKNTGKSLICQRLETKKAPDYDYQKGKLTVLPDKSNPIHKPFRIKIDEYEYGNTKNVSLKGNMPLSDNPSDSTKVYWGTWDGKAEYDTER